MRYMSIPFLAPALVFFVLELLVLIPCLGKDGESESRQVRKLFLKRDEIAQIRTSVGIATIIQVPDRPTSVVLGDTNAFKVEYLDTAVTIKPLSFSSRSNLYIYTEGRRFNVSLVTTPQAGADYIVYLYADKQQATSTKIKWRNLGAKNGNSNLTLTIRKLGVIENNLLVDFLITARKEIIFAPEWIWILQNGKTVPINGLSLSGTKLSPKTAITGGLVIRKEDILSPASLSYELRLDAPIKIKLPGVASWMK